MVSGTFGKLELSASSSALPQLFRHFPPAPQDSLLPASLFISLGTSLFAPQIQHFNDLLTCFDVKHTFAVTHLSICCVSIYKY